MDIFFHGARLHRIMTILICSLLLILSVFGFPFALASRRFLSFLYMRKIKLLNSRINSILRKGSAGEAAVNERISKMVKTMPILRDAKRSTGDIVLLNGDGQLSQEIDHIIVTKFAVVVIETKDWFGRISVLDDNSVLLDQGNRKEKRKSPIAQAKSKQTALRNILGPEVPLASTCVFTNPEVEFAQNCPFIFITLNKLEWALESLHKHYQGREVVDVEKTCERILARCDRSVQAKIIHMTRIAKHTKQPPADAIEVLDIDMRIKALSKKVDDPSCKPTIIEHIAMRIRPVCYWLLFNLFMIICIYSELPHHHG